MQESHHPAMAGVHSQAKHYWMVFFLWQGFKATSSNCQLGLHHPQNTSMLKDDEWHNSCMIPNFPFFLRLPLGKCITISNFLCSLKGPVTRVSLLIPFRKFYKGGCIPAPLSPVTVEGLLEVVWLNNWWGEQWGAWSRAGLHPACSLSHRHTQG